MGETAKCIYSNLWKTLVVKLRDPCFLQVIKKSHAHDLLESSPLGKNNLKIEQEQRRG